MNNVDIKKVNAWVIDYTSDCQKQQDALDPEKWLIDHVPASRVSDDEKEMFLEIVNKGCE